MIRLTLLAAALAVLAWSLNAIRAITADSLNTAPMLAAVSLLVVGLALGVVGWGRGADRRAEMTRKQRDDIARARTEHVLISAAVVGIVLGTCLEGAVAWWDWALLVAASAVAGLTFSGALLGALDDVRRAAHDSVRQA